VVTHFLSSRRRTEENSPFAGYPPEEGKEVPGKRPSPGGGWGGKDSRGTSKAKTVKKPHQQHQRNGESKI